VPTSKGRKGSGGEEEGKERGGRILDPPGTSNPATPLVLTMKLLQDGNGSAAAYCKYIWLLYLEGQLLLYDTCHWRLRISSLNGDSNLCTSSFLMLAASSTAR